MTEKRPAYSADQPKAPRPLSHLPCPCDNGGRPCGSDLLGLLVGDDEKETRRVVCPFCRNAVLVTVQRQPFMEVVEANPMPERGQ